MPASARKQPADDPDFAITPSGPFSLAESVAFGFGQRDGAPFDGVMRLAFCLDGYQRLVGVEVRQADAMPGPGGTNRTRGAGRAARMSLAGGDVLGTIRAPLPGGTTGDAPDVEAVRRQVARVLSLDHDGAQFLLVGERDPVIGRLQAAAPGLRPPLFYSPYEAAAWAVLSTRRQPRQMAQVRERLSRAHGAIFELAGQQLAAMPAPEQLLGVTSFPGIPADRVQRLHGVARAALDGQLDTGRLVQLGPERAMAALQSISGIGPFYSALIVIRAAGFTDVLPENEPRALALAARLYELPAPPTIAEFRALAEPWRPFRTWAAVLIRAVTGRVLDGQPGPERAGGSRRG